MLIFITFLSTENVVKVRQGKLWCLKLYSFRWFFGSEKARSELEI